MALGLGRASRHCFTLPASDELPELELDLLWAPPPGDGRAATETAPAVVLYVLDPEPVLFGVAALFTYGTSGYFPAAATPEATFRRLHVVGIGHAAGAFSAGAQGWDNATLRQLRRREFPPFEHPSIRAGRAPNACATRFAQGLADHVLPHVEQRLLGLETRPRRALLGASYSAVMALQVLLRRPDAFDDLVLGSPSVPFDPEILQPLATLEREPPAARPVGAFVAIGAEEREPAEEGLEEGRLCSRPGNVHRGIPDGAHELARVLRDRRVEVRSRLQGAPHCVTDQACRVLFFGRD